MECKKCKKECMESEIINGFCSECFKKYKGDITKLKKISNPIADNFKKWAICEIIAGIIIAVLCFIGSYGILVVLSIISVSLVIAAILRAISEIIQLLEDIKNK